MQISPEKRIKLWGESDYRWIRCTGLGAKKYYFTLFENPEVRKSECNFSRFTVPLPPKAAQNYDNIFTRTRQA